MSNRYDPVEIDGEIYTNPGQASEKLGVSRGTIYSTMSKRGISFEEAVRLYINKGEEETILPRNAVTYHENTFNSVRDGCSQLGLNYNTIYYRMSEFGISFEEAVDFDRKKHSRVSWGDEEFSNLRQACKDAGADYSKTYRRMKQNGMSFAEAIKEEKVVNPATSVTYEGVTYNSLYDACYKLKINYGTAYLRMKRKGITAEETIAISMQGKAETEKEAIEEYSDV